MLEAQMSTGLIVNLLLITVMAVGLIVGLIAREEHKRNAGRHARQRIKTKT